MLIYDETNKNNYTIETNDITYIYLRETLYNGKEWRILFVLGKSSVEWGYDTQEAQRNALKKVHKLLKAESVNFLEL